MELISIKVICHSGYKTDEYPKRFTWYEKEFEILEIVDRWYQTDRDPKNPAANYFKVKAIDGGQYILRNEIKTDKWFLVI